MRLMNPASRRLRKAARREAGNKTRDMTINPEWQNKPLFVTVKQAAGMLGVSHKTVYRRPRNFLSVISAGIKSWVGWRRPC